MTKITTPTHDWENLKAKEVAQIYTAITNVSPAYANLAQTVDWLAQGYNPQEIYNVLRGVTLRRKSQGHQPPHSLRYFNYLVKEKLRCS